MKFSRSGFIGVVALLASVQGQGDKDQQENDGGSSGGNKQNNNNNAGGGGGTLADGDKVVESVEVSGFRWSGCAKEIPQCKAAIDYGPVTDTKTLLGEAGRQEFHKFAMNVHDCEKVSKAKGNPHCFMEYNAWLTMNAVECKNMASAGYDFLASGLEVDLDFVSTASVWVSDPTPFASKTVTARVSSVNGGDLKSRCENMPEKAKTLHPVKLTGEKMTRNKKEYHGVWTTDPKKTLETTTQFTDDHNMHGFSLKPGTTFALEMKHTNSNFPPAFVSAQITYYNVHKDCDLKAARECELMDFKHKSRKVNRPSRLAEIGKLAKACEDANKKAGKKTCVISIEGRVIVPMTSCGEKLYGFDVGQSLLTEGGFDISSQDSMYVKIPAADVVKPQFSDMVVYTTPGATNTTQLERCKSLTDKNAKPPVLPIHVRINGKKTNKFPMKGVRETFYPIPYITKKVSVSSLTQFLSPGYEFPKGTYFAVKLIRAGMTPRPKTCRTSSTKPKPKPKN